MDRFARPRTSDLETRSQMKKENQGTSWGGMGNVAKYLGVAYLAISTGLQGAEGRLLRSESSDLASRGNDSRLPLPEVHAPQSFQGLGVQKPENVVQSELEAFSHPNGPTVQEIWPGLYKLMVEDLGEKGEASKSSLQGDAQGKPDRETFQAEPGQKSSLPHQLESTDSTSDSDSRHQYKNMEHEELSQSRESNIEWRRPTATDVKRLQQDKEFQREILSACQKPEAMEQLLPLAKDNRSKEALKEIIHHITLDKHFVEFIIDQCQDRKAMNVLAPLTNNEELIGHICSLIDVQDVKRIKRDLEARQEKARSHNLDATQASFKIKGSARKLLSNYDQSDNIALVREVKRGNQDSTSVNLKLMAATFVLNTVCFSVGLYFYHQGKKAAGEAREKLHKAQMDKLHERIDKLEEKKDKLKEKNVQYLKLLEEQRQKIDKLHIQLQLPEAPVSKEPSPPRTRSRLFQDREPSPPRKGYSSLAKEWTRSGLSQDREPSPPRKGSSLTDEDWIRTPRRRSHKLYENLD